MNYEEFRVEYERQHPASIPVMPEDVSSDYPSWLRFVVLLMFLSSALISGVHTVPTVYDGIETTVNSLIRGIVALGSFIAIEVSFFVSPFAQLHGDKRMSRTGLIVAFAIALAANINSVSKAMLTSGIGFLVTAVALIFGIGMPLLAFISGSLFVHMHTSSTRANKEAKKEYRETCKLFDATVLTAFRKYCKEEASARPSASVHSDKAERTGFGYDRSSDAKQTVIKYLDANPSDGKPVKDGGRTVRELADITGVGKSTAADALNEWRSGSLHTNGNGNGRSEAES